MAIQTFYFLNTTAVTPNFMGSMQQNGTAPTGAAAAFGWGPAKTAITTPYYFGYMGGTATQTTAQSGSYIISNGPRSGNSAAQPADFFISPTTLTGTFAAGNWVFTMTFRCTTAGAAGHPNVNIYRGSGLPVTGTNTVALVARNAGAGSTITLNATGTTFTSTLTVSVPASTFNNEYLIIQFEWQETTAGSSNNNNILFYQGGNVVTPDFQVAVTGPLASTDPPDTASIAGQVTGVAGTLSVTDVGDTSVIVGNASVFGPLTVTDLIDTSSIAGLLSTGPIRCTWNPGDLLGVTLTNNNLTATSRASL